MNERNYIQTEYIFSHRHIVLVISKRARFVHSGAYEEVLDKGISTEERQKRVQSLVEHYRPELKGCVVYAMQYRIERAEWELAVTHGSLPVTPDGQEAERQPLIPETWRDRGAML